MTVLNVKEDPDHPGFVIIDSGGFTIGELTVEQATTLRTDLKTAAARAILLREKAEKAKRENFLPVGTLIRVKEGGYGGEFFILVKTAEWGWARTDNNSVSEDSRVYGQHDGNWADAGTIIYQPAK